MRFVYVCSCGSRKTETSSYAHRAGVRVPITVIITAPTGRVRERTVWP